MCRFTVYKGRSIPIGDIILYPDHSLIFQSRDASYHPGVQDPLCRRNIRVNGDGFGVGWYSIEDNSCDCGCCLFKLTSPAWSNVNLRNIGQHVRAPVIFAHVRAASHDDSGFEHVVISDENCHPFKYGRYTFMHNGFIPNFSRVKRSLCLALEEEIYDGILGNTDSEHIFALFLSALPDRNNELPIGVLADTIQAVFARIINTCEKKDIFEPCSFNVALTDGHNIIATRFRNGDQEPPSLYYSSGCEFSYEAGNFLNKEESVSNEIVISSEPLKKRSRCCETGCVFDNWTLIPKDHMLLCVGDQSDICKLKSVSMIPIVLPDVTSGSFSLSSSPESNGMLDPA